jgi:predicted nucleotidyltransferase component of viral defense system
MIQERAITEWTNTVPWIGMQQVEQDLIICRAVIAIYSDEYLASRLAFRGGTALHKLYMSPQPRYSEDIDLVQITSEPVGSILDRLRNVLSFLGKPIVKQKRNNNTMVFRMDSTFPPIVSLRLKVEINCKEHLNVLGLSEIDFEVRNQWFTGKCKVITYRLDELIGTKLRALYQRKKGRDLFDLYHVLKNAEINPENVIHCYRQYMAFSDGDSPSKNVYIANMEEKMKEDLFLNDTRKLLHPDLLFNPQEAYGFVKTMLIDRL